MWHAVFNFVNTACRAALKGTTCFSFYDDSSLDAFYVCGSPFYDVYAFFLMA